ncbi:MAG: putative heme-binding domain-containing protein [Verrucomicrobiales bacterium]|jgi:putative heme-binding domain-containing protein
MTVTPIVQAALCLLWSGLLVEAGSISLMTGDTVAFVGGTDMVRMQKEGMVEAALTARFKDAAPKFRDLAWEGDTVYFQSTIGERWRKEAFGNWPEQLNRVGATVVIAQFGKMESLDGPERLGEFVQAYGALLDQFAQGGRRVVLLGPARFEWNNADASALPAYTEAIVKLAEERGVPFISSYDFKNIKRDGVTGLLVRSVQEKHRLWNEYWRPSNWKCLFGDDGERIFSNAAAGLPSFKDEWSTYTKWIAAAEKCIREGEEIVRPAAPQRTGTPDADIAAELAAFEVADGYEVNLFADESHGIANPLSVRWNMHGGMMVACSDAYPQIEPGVLPNDHIQALEDTDGDGRADRSYMIVDGLHIPTGMEVGADGIYVGQNTELLHLDHHGNRIGVLLSGFGNGDSHQTINSFTWSPGGELWFCQGDGIESRIETPQGVSSLFQAGVFRLRPRELRLDGLLDDSMGPGNPWGIAFDDYGQSFVIDGAGGISYLTPGSIPVKRRLKLPRIGKPGGYCGIECLGDGEFVLGDYKQNQVSRFSVIDDGAGFKVEWQKPLLRSKHRNFRPVDVKSGPDGAIYVVDWYNPITCHQDDFYRHPDRDKTHGRIWRVAPKNLAPAAPPMASLGLDDLRSDNRWIRMKAKQSILLRIGLTSWARYPKTQRDIERLRSWEVPAAAREWQGRDLLEIVSLLEMLDRPDGKLLERLLNDADFRARAYAARVTGRWGKRLDNAHVLLDLAARDAHPRVRMEAVLACAEILEPRSVLIAATVAESPRDHWIDYAFAQVVHYLKPHWIPAFQRGELDFGKNPKGLAAVLGRSDSKALLSDMRRMIEDDKMEDGARVALGRAMILVGEQEDLQTIFDLDPPNTDLLLALAQRRRPTFAVEERLGSLLKNPSADVRAATMALVGAWKISEFGSLALKALAAGNKDEASFRTEAIRALGLLELKEAMPQLGSIVRAATDPDRAVAMQAMVHIDETGAAAIVAAALADTGSDVGHDAFHAFAARDGAMSRLADQLGETEISTDRGKSLHRTWIASGLVNERMTERLAKLAEQEISRSREFSSELVKLMVAAGRSGDVANGKSHFNSAALGCAACHKTGAGGGAIGPDLSAVGSGVPPDRIVTEVMWPTLQIKEGYSLTVVTLHDKRQIQGYVQKSRDSAKVLLRDFATGAIHDLRKDEIATQVKSGSLMPPTAQTLNDSELRDLFAYLFSLQGNARE